MFNQSLLFFHGGILVAAVVVQSSISQVSFVLWDLLAGDLPAILGSSGAEKTVVALS